MSNTIKIKQIDQTQLAAFVNDILDGTGAVYTANRALVTDGAGDVTTSSVTATELGYLSGVTSAIQTQFNNLGSTYLALAGGTMTGNLTISGASLFVGGSYAIAIGDAGNGYYGGWMANTYLALSPNTVFGWNSGDGTTVKDLVLARDAADVLALRRSTNAQTMRVYGTYTDASNYVRASLAATSTAVTLAAETAGTGADDISISLNPAGTGVVGIGGLTSSYPALKRSGTELQVRLADDSGYAPIAASSIVLNVPTSLGPVWTLGSTSGEGYGLSLNTNGYGMAFVVRGSGPTGPMLAEGMGVGNLYVASRVGWGQDMTIGREPGSSTHTYIFGESSGVLGQRNSTNAQTFRVYGTYTDASNYVRASLAATSTSVTLAAQTAGTGADDVDLYLRSAGRNSWISIEDGNARVDQSTYGGGYLFDVTFNYVPSFRVATGYNLVGLGHSMNIVWHEERVGTTQDTGISRTSAGLVEVNNGTPGTYRDLKLRTLYGEGGTVTASAPVLDISQTWNNAAVAFQGARIKITNNASLPSPYGYTHGSMPFVITDGSDNVMSGFGRDGGLWFGGSGYSQSRLYKTGSFGVTVLDCSPFGGGNAGFEVFGGTDHQVGALINPLATYPTVGFSFGLSNRLGAASNAAQQFWFNDGTIHQRNGNVAQTYYIYGAYTDASNYVRASFAATSTSVTLAAQTAGTGADDVNLVLSAAGTGYVSITQSSNVGLALKLAGINYGGGNSPNTIFLIDGYSTSPVSTTNAVFSVGAAGHVGIDTSWFNANYYVANSLTINGVYGFRVAADISTFSIHSDYGGNNLDQLIIYRQSGNMVLMSGGGMLGIGGLTSSYPALKRNGTELQVRLADDSGYATTAAGCFTSHGSQIDPQANGYWMLRHRNSDGGAYWGFSQKNGGTNDIGVFIAGTLTSTIGYKFEAHNTNGGLGWSSSPGAAGPNLVIVRDTTDVVAIYGTTNAALRLYGAYTDASNYVRASLAATSTSVTLSAETAGTGADDISISLNPAGTGVVGIGGLTSSYPALKRSSTELQVRLADDSGYANIRAANLITQGELQTDNPYLYMRIAGMSALILGADILVYQRFLSLGSTGANYADCSIGREAAGVLAQRNDHTGAALVSQTFRIYGARTDDSNYVRASLAATSTSVTLAAETAGTGADNIDLNLVPAGTGQTVVTSLYAHRAFTVPYQGGKMIQVTALDGRTITFGSTVSGYPAIMFGNDLTTNVEANGVIVGQSGSITINAPNGVTLGASGGFAVSGPGTFVSIGGTSASYPALKRSSTELQVRLADDSGYANLAINTLYVGNNGQVTTPGALGGWRFYNGLGPIMDGSGGQVIFETDANYTLALRYSTNAQTLRVYGTYTDASNYVRASLAATSTTVTLAAETAGTGADDIDLILSPAGAGKVGIGTASPTQLLSVGSVFKVSSTGVVTIKTGGSGLGGNQGLVAADGVGGIALENGTLRIEPMGAASRTTIGNGSIYLGDGAVESLKYDDSTDQFWLSQPLSFAEGNAPNGVYDMIRWGDGAGTSSSNPTYVAVSALKTAANEYGLTFDVSTAATKSERMRLSPTGFLGIGTTSPTHLLSLGGNSARTIWMERHTTSDTAGNNLTVQAGSATSGATNKAGGYLDLLGGISTGTGESGVRIKGYVAGSSGTSDTSASTMIEVLGNKVGFFGVTPVVRQTTGIAAATFVANTSAIADDTATWGGYTAGQIVTALKNVGILT